MSKCERCEADMPWCYGPTTSLVGGVVATLCARCRTEWNEFAAQHPTFQRLRELECVLSSLIHTPPQSMAIYDRSLQRALKEIRECEATLHDEGLKWLGRDEVNGNHSDDQSAN